MITQRTIFWHHAQGALLHGRCGGPQLHRTTGEKPALRFCPDALRPLPDVLADCRHSAVVKVHKDFSINFDGNCYTVPPWLVGKRLTLRADERSAWLFFNEKQVAVYLRSWQRRQRVELPQHREAALPTAGTASKKVSQG